MWLHETRRNTEGVHFERGVGQSQPSSTDPSSPTDRPAAADDIVKSPPQDRRLVDSTRTSGPLVMLLRAAPHVRFFYLALPPPHSIISPVTVSGVCTKMVSGSFVQGIAGRGQWAQPRKLPPTFLFSCCDLQCKKKGKTRRIHPHPHPHPHPHRSIVADASLEFPSMVAR